MSVFSFLKIIAKLNKYHHILKYNENEEMNKRVDGFKVKMGFGLHQGWAIEGAIGSFFKIDASYLSPNVNMAARLEAATGQFGTLLLLSGDLHDILSTKFQSICREIDTVTVKGSIKPMRLFTVSIQTHDMEPDQDPLYFRSIKEKKSIRDKMRKELLGKLNTEKISTWEEINSDRDFLELRKHLNLEFESVFKLCYASYLKGDWTEAGIHAKKLIELCPDDGPSVSLNYTINIRFEGKCPEWWDGFRPLTSK